MYARESEHFSTHSGFCLCKGVKFIVKGQPNAVFCCYCEDCRLGAGGPCQITASYFSSHFALHDPDSLVSCFTISNNTINGKVKEKYFCKRCGCTLFTIPFGDDCKDIAIRPALIKQGLRIFKPSIECFTRRGPSYFSACLSAMQYDSMPK